MQNIHHNDIVSEKMKDNDTWTSCSACGKTWKEPKATPGVIHRFTVCGVCKKNERERA